MRSQHRPRHYIREVWVLLLRPLFRYSSTRDAFVLRAIGNTSGPVLRIDRRRRSERRYTGVERRRVGVA
jgi:hypothetical protein